MHFGIRREVMRGVLTKGACGKENRHAIPKEASGHKSDRYIWRYVKPSQQSLAAAIDELDA